MIFEFISTTDNRPIMAREMSKDDLLNFTIDCGSEVDGDLIRSRPQASTKEGYFTVPYEGYRFEHEGQTWEVVRTEIKSTDPSADPGEIESHENLIVYAYCENKSHEM